MPRRVAMLVAALMMGGLAMVAGPAVAAEVPQLLTVSASATAVAVPGEVTLSYTALVDAPVTQALAGYHSPDGRNYSITLTEGASGSGALTLPDGVANGTWTLAYLWLNSAAGQSYNCRDASVSPTCTRIVDLSGSDFTVSGSTLDRDAPLVSSVSVTPGPVQPGEPLAVSWADTEAHALASVSFSFLSREPEARGSQVVVASTDPAALAAHQLTVPLKATAFNGVYGLASFSIKDSLGNQVTYLPDGVTRLAGWATTPTSHTLDLAATSFTVTGSTQDAAPPVLVSLHNTYPAQPIDEPVQVGYTVTDQSTPLKSLGLVYNTPDGGTMTLAPSGTAIPPSGQIPLYAGFGTYQLSEVWLQDGVGRSVQYRRDGTTYDPLTKVVAANGLDLAAFDVTVRPSQPEIGRAWALPGGATLQWGSRYLTEARQLASYRITVNPGGRVITVPADPAGNGQHYTVTGLRNGVAYTFTLVAVDRYGHAGPPASTVVTPRMSDHFFSPGNITGDRRDDLAAFGPSSDNASVWLYRRTAGSYAARTLSVPHLDALRVAPAGDTRLVGFPDVLVVSAYGELDLHTASGSGWDSGALPIGTGWGGMRFVTSGTDLTGDRRPDIVAVTATGYLYLYPFMGTSTPRLGARRYIGSGWGTMQAVFSPGDFNGDRKADLMAVDASGLLWLYRGDGRGGFLPRIRVGSGWDGYAAVFALRNFSGTGRADIGAVDMAGNLYRYAGTGTGRLGGRTLIGHGWNTYF